MVTYSGELYVSKFYILQQMNDFLEKHDLE